MQSSNNSIPQEPQIDEKIALTLNGIPTEKRNKIISLIVEQRTEICGHHQGPIPCPEDIALYNQYIPDGANRIMKMAEEQSSHRRELESIVIKNQQKQSLLGQIFGFIIGVLGILSGAFLGMNGHEAIGSIIAGGTVVSLVSVFVIGKKQQQKDLKSKQETS